MTLSSSKVSAQTDREDPENIRNFVNKIRTKTDNFIHLEFPVLMFLELVQVFLVLLRFLEGQLKFSEGQLKFLALLMFLELGQVLMIQEGVQFCLALPLQYFLQDSQQDPPG